jgi:hypothetical protein
VPTVYPMTFFAPEKQRNYPHMAKRDVALWERFLDAHGQRFISISYDVSMGGTRPEIPDEDPLTLLGFQYSSALKVDAIGWQTNQAWLIEVRPEATVSAYGSAVVYTLVARREEITQLPIVPTIVCEAIQPDVSWACAMTGIQVVRV